MRKPVACNCDRCPLKKAGSIPLVPQERVEGKILFLGDYPSSNDVDLGRPFSSAFALAQQRKNAGFTKENSVLTTLLPCELSGEKLAKVVAQGKKKGLISPFEACRPYWEPLVRAAGSVITLGKVPYEALNGKGFEKARGKVFETEEGQKRIATYNPNVVGKNGELTAVMGEDIDRARAFFDGRIEFVEPEFMIIRSFGELLIRLPFTGSWSWDIETIPGAGCEFDALTDQLCLFGWGDDKKAFVLALRHKDGTPLMPLDHEEACLKLLCQWLSSDEVHKYGHNIVAYDLPVMSATFARNGSGDFEARNCDDTLIMHQLADSEMPHSLDFNASRYTTAVNWKNPEISLDEAGLYTWSRYNAIDIVITARIAPKIGELGEAAGIFDEIKPHSLKQPSITLYEVATRMQLTCNAFRVRGLPVDAEAVEVHRDRLGNLLKGYHTSLQETAGKTFSLKGIELDEEDEASAESLNSGKALRKLLFDEWDLPLAQGIDPRDLFTTAGELSVKASVLQAYADDEEIPDQARSFCSDLLKFRSAHKLLSTFIEPLAGKSHVHPEWKAVGTVVGRVSCRAPNAANVPKECRNVYKAPPGYTFIDADQDAIHMRIIASLWNVKALLETFLPQPGKEIVHRGLQLGAHEQFASVLFGSVFLDAPFGEWPTENKDEKWLGRSLEIRQVAKTVRYAGAYGAGVPTIYAALKDAGYTGSIEGAGAIYAKWMSLEPEWRIAWENELELWRANGFLADPVHGRRRKCSDGNRNDILNFRVISTEAAIMNEVTVKLFEACNENFGRSAQLIHQNYDSVLVLVREDLADECAALVKECMAVKLPGFPVPFIGNPAIRNKWS